MTSPHSTRTSNVANLRRERHFRRRCYIASILFAVLVSTLTSSALWSSNGLWVRMRSACSACGSLGAEKAHRLILGPGGPAYYTCQPEQRATLFILPPEQSTLESLTDDR